MTRSSNSACAQFQAANVTALVVDLRYNGGGLVSPSRLLANLIGGFIADGQVQARTVHNSVKSALDQTNDFETQASSLTLLNNVVFVTTGNSASASELVDGCATRKLRKPGLALCRTLLKRQCCVFR